MDKIKNKKIIEITKDFVKEQLGKDTTGHDYWHSLRVYNNAVAIAKEESKTKKVDLFLVELTSILHDIDDWKFNEGQKNDFKKITDFLRKQNVEELIIDKIKDIISSLSFRGAKVESKMKTIECMIVQDADRLDAIGAIAVARTFATGQKLGRLIHTPDIKPFFAKTFDEYKKSSSKGGSINHFYEKLLLLKDLMNTKTAKSIAKKRHKFMEQFIEEFYIEWDGKDLV